MSTPETRTGPTGSRSSRGRGPTQGWMRRLSPQDRRAILLGLLVVIPALGWVGAVRPWWHRVQTTREALDTEWTLLERERKLLEDAPSLPDLIGSTDLALRRKQARLVRYPNTALAEAAIAGHLEESAAANRVLLLEARGLQPAPQEMPMGGLRPIRLQVRAESDFEGILNFLNSLEGDPLLLSITALSIRPEDDPGVMTIEAIIEAYTAAEIPKTNADPREQEL